MKGFCGVLFFHSFKVNEMRIFCVCGWMVWGGKREVCTLISLSEKAREESVMGFGGG
jgi:hypothetical protein